MTTRPISAWLAATIAAFALAACGGGGGSDEPRQAPLSSRDGASGATTIAQPASTEGRLLASNCFQCHGTLGLGGFDRIRGGEAKEVLEFAAKAADRDIMAAHAQGYTPEQLRKIIAYLQQ